MSPICSSCLSAINKKSPGPQCQGPCKKYFHANTRCCELSRDVYRQLHSTAGVLWRCAPCRAAGGQRSRSASLGSDVEVDADGATPGAHTPGNVDALAVEMRNVQRELRLLRESVTFCSNKVTDFELQLSKLNECIKTTEVLKAENAIIKDEIKTLQAKLNDVEQSALCNNIEIHGVPEKAGENLNEVFRAIGTHVNYPLQETMIDTLYRVPTRDPKLPKNIIVKFASRKLRDSFLAAVKTKRLSVPRGSRGIKIDNVSDGLYVNEHLTTANKILYRSVRDVAREKQYKYVWIRGGKIFARKDDRARVLHVRDAAAVSKM